MVLVLHFSGGRRTYGGPFFISECLLNTLKNSHRIISGFWWVQMYNIGKLIDFAYGNADKIALDWCRNVKNNPRTSSYHNLSDEYLTAQALDFYKTLRPMFLHGYTSQSMTDFADKYASRRMAEGIPLQEAIYALIMMRRQIWLFAEFQLMFTTALDMYQAVESINKLVLLTDYAIYTITRKYQQSYSKNSTVKT